MSDPEKLFHQLREAKVFEAEAKALRIEAEQAVLALVEDPPESGSTTLQFGTMGRITCKWGLSYKADMNALRGMEDVPEEVLPLKLVPAKYELDKKAYEALRKTHPDVFAKVAAHVVTKPGKPSLTLKV